MRTKTTSDYRVNFRFAPSLMTAGLVSALVVGATLAVAQQGDVEMSPISGDPDNPRRHFRLRHPAELAHQEAAEIYALISDSLSAGYGRSGLSAVGEYRTWTQANSAPYLSATHGNHYLNNYVNETGAATYTRFEKGGTMPVGTVIAKDSFSVTQSRSIVLGPLFVMEKMPAGFNYVTDDWKYLAIQADGTVLGETGAPGAERVEYCIACHLARKQYDHLYFIPPAYRSE